MCGVLCVLVEETGRVLSERRVGLLGKLASEMAAHHDGGGALAGLQRKLAADARDFPFSLTYITRHDAEEASLLRIRLRQRPPVLVHGTEACASPKLSSGRRSAWRSSSLRAWPQSLARQPTRARIVLPLADPGQARAAGALVSG